MNSANQTMVIYFIIRGVSDIPELQALIFLLVLLIYLFTIGGNMTIVLLVCLDHKLNTPMYFFLCNLSILDMCSTTVTLHRVLMNFISGDNTVSFPACMAQMYTFAFLEADELFLLTVMSYDRYVAICNPMHYLVIMNCRVCALLATVSWVLGSLESLPHVIIISRFSCFRTNEINHFFCDVVPLLKLSCSDTSAMDIFIFIGGIIHVMVSFSITLIPYIFIIATILRIQSNSGRSKAFYTCSSHLTVVILLYGTIVFQYLTPTSANSLDSNKLFSLLNTAVVPTLNPLIYSLKNKDVKSALRRRLRWQFSFK
ncbi:olfactory receptor 8U3-like [Rhinophrynus dorsalis]